MTDTIEKTDGQTIPNLRLHAVKIRNMMRLTSVEVGFDPDDHLVVVGGRNMQGKSSFLDSIAAAFLKGKPSDMPIHQGARKAEETVVLCGDDGAPLYAIQKTFSEKRTECNVIDMATGETLPDARALLDDLTAKGFGFDPAAFARQCETAAGRRAQFETLRAITGLDMSDLNVERERVFSERTGVKRIAERLQGQLADAPIYLKAPKAPVDVAELNEQYRAAQLQQSELGTLRTRFQAKKDRKEEIERRLAELRAELETVTEELQAIQAEGKAKRETAVDPAPILEQLQQASEMNRQVMENARRRQLQVDADAEDAKAAELTQRLAEIDAEKAARMQAIVMPLPGLALADDGETVLYQGKPLSVASSAEQLRVSTAVGIAMLKQLKLIIIRNGSFLDRANLRMIAEMAAAAGVQVLVERVGVDGASFVIEDGTVADEETIARLVEEERG